MRCQPLAGCDGCYRRHRIQCDSILLINCLDFRRYTHIMSVLTPNASFSLRLRRCTPLGTTSSISRNSCAACGADHAYRWRHLLKDGIRSRNIQLNDSSSANVAGQPGISSPVPRLYRGASTISALTTMLYSKRAVKFRLLPESEGQPLILLKMKEYGSTELGANAIDPASQTIHPASQTIHLAMQAMQLAIQTMQLSGSAGQVVPRWHRYPA